MKHLPVLVLLILLACPIWAQNQPIYAGLSNDDQLSFVGMMMADMLERFGTPRSVVPERGREVWQDDVVFQYNGVDFYVYRDRVWQIKIASTHGISNGDRKPAALLALGSIPNGSAVEDKGDHAIITISGRIWSLIMRVNFSNTSNTGQVTAIYIYRPDF